MDLKILVLKEFQVLLMEKKRLIQKLIKSGNMNEKKLLDLLIKIIMKLSCFTCYKFFYSLNEKPIDNFSDD